MGRTASISKQDVALARQTLIERQQPHGIIAIRREIGRGSPQLISRFVSELNLGSTRSNLPDPIAKTVTKVWDEVWTEAQDLLESKEQAIDAQLAQLSFENEQLKSSSNELSLALTELKRRHGEDLGEISNLEKQNAALGGQLDAARVETQSLRSQISQLEKQLMQQQELFESWRQDHMGQQELLKAQLRAFEPIKKARSKPSAPKRGTQLDLYGDSDED